MHNSDDDQDHGGGMEHDYRVGDAERDLVIERLQTHYDAGRLSLDEMLERTEAAQTAITWTELATVLRDLPHDDPRRQGWRTHATVAAITIGGLIGLWQITRDPTPAPKDYGADYWWPLWAAFFCGLTVLLHYLHTTGRLTLSVRRHPTAKTPLPAPGPDPQTHQLSDDHPTEDPAAGMATPLEESTPNSPSTTPLDTLTPREREILVLLAEGHANKQIAQRLVISERTARTHVSNILRKLGLPSRTQAALIATRAGLAKPTQQ